MIVFIEVTEPSLLSPITRPWTTPADLGLLSSAALELPSLHYLERQIQKQRPVHHHILVAILLEYTPVPFHFEHIPATVLEYLFEHVAEKIEEVLLFLLLCRRHKVLNHYNY